MNELTEAYCNGAAMAYRDVAHKLRDMVEKCPAELRPLMEGMLPFAESCEQKARLVYDEAKQYSSGVRQ
jgi:hypothetical protein